MADLQKMVACLVGRKRAREAVLRASSSTFGFQILALDRRFVSSRTEIDVSHSYYIWARVLPAQTLASHNRNASTFGRNRTYKSRRMHEYCLSITCRSLPSAWATTTTSTL